jgi:hypothetical protein
MANPNIELTMTALKRRIINGFSFIKHFIAKPTSFSIPALSQHTSALLFYHIELVAIILITMYILSISKTDRIDAIAYLIFLPVDVKVTTSFIPGGT